MECKTTIEQTTEESLVMAILELAGILNKRGLNVTANTGITTQQWLVLLHLYGDPNIPQFKSKLPKGTKDGWLASEIAAALNVSRPYMTNVVNSLLEKDLIQSNSSLHDQRKKLLTLTEKGEDTIHLLQPHRQAANQHLFKGLGGAERKAVLEGLNKCLLTLRNPYRGK